MKNKQIIRRKKPRLWMHKISIESMRKADILLRKIKATVLQNEKLQKSIIEPNHLGDTQSEELNSEAYWQAGFRIKGIYLDQKFITIVNDIITFWSAVFISNERNKITKKWKSWTGDIQQLQNFWHSQKCHLLHLIPRKVHK